MNHNEQAVLKAVLWYDPETGVFIRRSTGEPAGSTRIGLRARCLAIRVSALQSRKQFLAHRLAWLYMTGKWPKDEIDHINGNSLDNRWINLREVDRCGQMQNIHRLPRTATGLMGVRLTASKRYQARIRANNKTIVLGMFDDAIEASNAYLKAKDKLHV